MRIKLPSFRIQIIILASLVTLAASLILREFFVDNLVSYQTQINTLNTKEKIRELYKDFNTALDSTQVYGYDQAVEAILRDLQKNEIAADFYVRDLKRYSLGMVVLMVILVVGIFLMLFIVITRPITHLMTATDELKKGNFDFQVRESRFSPLNDLIIEFNGMVRELNESRERLIEAEKQTIWKEMARAMAHEIKNPLTPIRLAAQRLEAKFNDKSEDLPAVTEKTLGIINEEVSNLQSLVDAFSGFAKMPEARFERYNLNKQLQEISNQYIDEARIEMNLDDRLEHIYADSMQLKQVLVNLIQNAIQACPGEPHIVLTTKVNGDLCTISIKDHGSGIARDDLKKIFEPYFTTKKKGTGLGLAIVRRIVHLHGGDISAESRLEKGTTFTISLPCNQEQEEKQSIE